MMYLFITLSFLLLLGIMLLIPSVFTRKMTTLLVSIAFLFAMGTYFLMQLIAWPYALGTALILALASSYLIAKRMPEEDVTEAEEENSDDEDPEIYEAETETPILSSAETGEAEPAEEDYYYQPERKPLENTKEEELQEEEEADLSRRTSRDEEPEESPSSDETSEDSSLSRRERLFKQLEDEDR